MANVLGVLGGAALVVVAVVGLVGWHVYRSFPDVVPPEETALSARTYAAVRAGVVAGGALGTLGAGLAIIDTLGTVAAAKPGDGGALAEAARAIPEWVASTAPLAGAALLAGSALLALGSEVQAWLATDE